MAKEIARFVRTDGDCGIAVTQTLIVYENKCSYRGEVWDSYFKGWKSPGHKPVQAATFYEKDGDMDLFRVCEYFGFDMSNRLM